MSAPSTDRLAQLATLYVKHGGSTSAGDGGRSAAGSGPWRRSALNGRVLADIQPASLTPATAHHPADRMTLGVRSGS
jgi:hypothetical protein